MFADFTVPVPEQKGKISRQNSGGRIYIHYILDRTYNPKTKKTHPHRKIIGRLAEDGVSMRGCTSFSTGSSRTTALTSS